ncbi:MAG: GvpL/GvpF family gas vesicle protein, partial [Marmoricola sp.]|nr:GvpL/GvpF family gas vesicle protein [Marmoricola sp.]
DAAVDYVGSGDLVAAVSTVAFDRPPGRRAELVAHSRVVDTLAEHGPVIPIQFGSVIDDVEAVRREVLEAGADRLAATLDRLTGLAQLNLRAKYVEEQVLAEVVRADPTVAELRRRTRDLPPGTPHPDLVRLGERVSQGLDRLRASDGDDLVAAVRPLVADLHVRPGTAPDHLLDASLLVERSRVSDVEQLLEDLAEAWHERILLRLVGPVAPYDFVEVEAWG